MHNNSTKTGILCPVHDILLSVRFLEKERLNVFFYRNYSTD